MPLDPAYRTTFADLGIPFSLFEAPVVTGGNFYGIARCSVCGRPNAHCFSIRDIVLACKKCDVQTLLPVEFHERTWKCPACTAANPFPTLVPQPVTFIPDACGHVEPDTLEISYYGVMSDFRAITVCYQCLRAGRTAYFKHTHLGSVWFEDAVRGQIQVHGSADEATELGFECTPVEPPYSLVHVPSEMLFDLLRTPDYNCIQGEGTWFFCCRRPMIFIGIWKEREFEEHAAGKDPADFLAEVMRLDLWLQQIAEVMDRKPTRKDHILWAEKRPSGRWCWPLEGVGGPYVFRCPVCGRFRAHEDLD